MTLAEHFGETEKISQFKPLMEKWKDHRLKTFKLIKLPKQRTNENFEREF